MLDAQPQAPRDGASTPPVPVRSSARSSHERRGVVVWVQEGGTGAMPCAQWERGAWVR